MLIKTNSLVYSFRSHYKYKISLDITHNSSKNIKEPIIRLTISGFISVFWMVCLYWVNSCFAHNRSKGLSEIYTWICSNINKKAKSYGFWNLLSEMQKNGKTNEIFINWRKWIYHFNRYCVFWALFWFTVLQFLSNVYFWI